MVPVLVYAVVAGIAAIGVLCHMLGKFQRRHNAIEVELESIVESELARIRRLEDTRDLLYESHNRLEMGFAAVQDGIARQSLLQGVTDEQAARYKAITEAPTLKGDMHLVAAAEDRVIVDVDGKQIALSVAREPEETPVPAEPPPPAYIGSWYEIDIAKDGHPVCRGSGARLRPPDALGIKGVAGGGSVRCWCPGCYATHLVPTAVWATFTPKEGAKRGQ